MLRSLTLGGAVAAAALATAFAGPAQAASSLPTPLYGGGSTLIQLVARDLFNCYASDSAGSLDYELNGSTVRTTGTGCLNSTTNTVPVNPAAELLYAPVGSGAGQSAFITHNPVNFTTPTSVNPPYTSTDFPSYPYASVTFAGSDVPMNATQVATAAGLGFGQPIQVPDVITSVTVPFNPGPDGTGNSLRIRRPAPVVAGVTGSSGLMLSRDNLCGIFNGDINDWSDVAFAADNNGHQLTTAPTPITIIYRDDGSGTTGLFAAALIAQCANTAHPQPAQWAADNANTPPYTKYFVNAKAHLPSNFHDEKDFDGAGGTAGSETGNSGVIDAIINKPFAIGYSSPDFTAPFGVAPHLYPSGTAPVAANIQNQASVTSGAKKFIPPGAATAKLIMSAAPAPTSADPNAWAAAGQNPDPGGNNTYPLGGFSWLYFYECYSNATLTNDLVKGSIPGFLSWLYGASPDVPAILANHGFSPLPATWKTAIKGYYTQGTFSGAAKIRKAPSAGVCAAGA